MSDDSIKTVHQLIAADFCSAMKLELVFACSSLGQIALDTIDAGVRPQRAISVALAATFRP